MTNPATNHNNNLTILTVYKHQSSVDQYGMSFFTVGPLSEQPLHQQYN